MLVPHAQLFDFLKSLEGHDHHQDPQDDPSDARDIISSVHVRSFLQNFHAICHISPVVVADAPLIVAGCPQRVLGLLVDNNARRKLIWHKPCVLCTPALCRERLALRAAVPTVGVSDVEEGQVLLVVLDALQRLLAFGA